ncbi:MAG: LacI family DNA-binding transcriptional regulator [Alphaproteobacteria bacterium]|nr:LacI family DNA-binding transcriptional regulator [Alphaproteobacteria bacterium]
MSTTSSEHPASEPQDIEVAVGKPSALGIRRDPAMDAVVTRLLDERAQLIAAMEADGVSIRELARRAGVSPAAVSRQLGQEKDMLIGTSTLLAHYLGREWRQTLAHSRHAPDVARNFRIVDHRSKAPTTGDAGFAYVTQAGASAQKTLPPAPSLTVI